MTRTILAIALLGFFASPILAGCSSQFYTRNEFRSQHHVRLTENDGCAKAKAFDPTWQPEECR